MGSGFEIKYHPDVLKKDMKEIDGRWLGEIESAILSKLVVNPLLFGKPLRYSLKMARTVRVGDYRITYAVQGKVVYIGAIAHRTVIYHLALQRFT